MEPRESPPAVLIHVRLGTRDERGDELDCVRSLDAVGREPLYENQAAFATQPGSLAPGAPGIRDALNGFIAMNGTLDLEVTRVLEVDDLALVVGVWSFNGTSPDGEPVRLAAKNADVLRRQADGTWRFVIDNPWGTD